jgi:peptidoglycan/xylan/chitin deacetylase (PgdA/CDA1 family)
VRAVFFVPTCKVDQRGYLSRGDFVTLHQSGHVLGSHSHCNRRLDGLSPGELREDLERSTELIASISNERPVFFAPPGGFCSHRIKLVAAENGYRFLRTMDWGYNRHLDLLNIQVLPMTGSMGGVFLRMGLAQESEFLVRTTFRMKNCLRSALRPRCYAGLRGMIFHRGTH